MCFNGEIHAVPIFITIHLKQSWIHYGLTETHFSPNPMDNILLNEMSELTTSSDSWLWLCVERPSLHLSLKIIIETLESMFQPLWWAVGTEAMLAKDMGLLGLRIKVKQLKKNYSPGGQSRNILTLIPSQATPLPRLNASTSLWAVIHGQGWHSRVSHLQIMGVCDRVTYLCTTPKCPWLKQSFPNYYPPNSIKKCNEGDYRKLFKVNLNEWICLNC